MCFLLSISYKACTQASAIYISPLFLIEIIEGCISAKVGYLGAIDLSLNKGILCESPIYLSAMPGVDNAAKLSLDYGSSESAPILGRMNWLISHDELYAMCGGENGNFGCEISK